MTLEVVCDNTELTLAKGIPSGKSPPASANSQRRAGLSYEERDLLNLSSILPGLSKKSVKCHSEGAKRPKNLSFQCSFEILHFVQNDNPYFLVSPGSGDEFLQLTHDFSRGTIYNKHDAVNRFNGFC